MKWINSVIAKFLAAVQANLNALATCGWLMTLVFGIGLTCVSVIRNKVPFDVQNFGIGMSTIIGAGTGGMALHIRAVSHANAGQAADPAPAGGPTESDDQG